MRKSDIQFGAEYAYGDKYRHETYTCAHVVADRDPDNNTIILVRFLEDAPGNIGRSVLGWGTRGGGSAGDVKQLTSARDLMPWAQYVAAKAAADAERAARDREFLRTNQVIAQITEQLERYGFMVGGWGDAIHAQARAGSITLNVDTMAELLRRIDPIRIADDAIRAVAAARGYTPDDEDEQIVQQVLQEIREGIAVTDADIAGDPNPHESRTP